MMSVLGLVSLRGRPAIQEASELDQGPMDLHDKFWRDDLLKREWNRLVPFFKVSNAFRPVCSYDFTVIVTDQLVDLRRNLGQAVGPCRQNAIGFKHASHFAVKLVKVEPVDRNRNSDQVRAGGVERDMLGGFHVILHSVMWIRKRNLFRTGIGRMDVVKVCGESQRGLSIPGTTVPGQGTSGCQGGKIGINFIWVFRAVLRVLFGLP